jgi:hypothetical protein
LKETSPRQASLDDPPSWQQNEAALCLGVFDDLQLDAMLGRRVGCGRTLNIGQLHAATGDLLDLFGQPLDLGAVLFARRGHVQGKQMAQRIDRRMYLRPLASLGAIVSGPRSRLRRRLQRAAIDDHRRRLRLAPCELAQQRTHILHQDLEDPARIQRCVC